ncbi:MAG: hypothetical protein EZS28_049107 [Streblomastix strix]|uniref:Uncharacterized protein n=1 Tax=Streblomastix strix TaxID=222440 RepID=A0A5J4TAU9_9EUKA|nr:MAG: hypothetical protein EZS28_049107 [Streblomastix strix]
MELDEAKTQILHHIMWRGRDPEALSKTTGRFTLSQIRKILLEMEHLFNSEQNIVEARDQTLSSAGMGGKTA